MYTTAAATDPTSDAAPAPAEPRRRSRPGRLSLTGGALCLVVGAMSVTPSLCHGRGTSRPS